MDANKLKVLQDIDYRIRKCCGNCVFGVFVRSEGFGTCGIQQYEHKKHTGDKRQLSVNRYGYCEKHEISDTYVARIHGFSVFVED